MFFLFCFFLTLGNVYGSHFRGGVFMVRPVENQPNKTMEISYYISWRQSSNCTFSAGEGTLTCFSGCSGTISDLSYKCVQFNETEQWTLGENTVVSNLSRVNPSSDIITIGYFSCCWINGVVSRSDWYLNTTFSLALREDTGEINSTPRVTTFPVIRLLSGCNHTIPLPVTDPDNDVIKCQWADGIIPTGAVLNSDTCTITYDTSNGTGYEVIALVIEDFTTEDSTEPLSQVGIQFLVLVYSDSSESCPDPPEPAQSQPSPSLSISPSPTPSLSPSPTPSISPSPTPSLSLSPSPAQPQCKDSSLQCKQFKVKQICEAMKIRRDIDLPPRCSLA